ncbi:hypothetical protein MKZ18_06680 [Priestia sp. FSL W8-0001]|uniref:hypothetical protein n=1 Tax=unclassified Priestia TaxID=2800374 RepID=UPI0030F94852
MAMEKSMLNYDESLQQNIAGNTHKVLYLNPETLEIMAVDYVTPPFVLGVDSLKTANMTAAGINVPYIIVEKDYNGVITQDLLTDFQREIAYKVLEDNYKQAQLNLMAESDDYEEYLMKDTMLKKKYFAVKKEIAPSIAPLLLDLSLV